MTIYSYTSCVISQDHLGGQRTFPLHPFED